MHGSCSSSLLKTIPVEQAININETIKSYTARLKAFINMRISSEEDAEDILQDVFYQLVEAERLTKPIEELTAWLFTVTRNRITDWYRKKKPERLAGLNDDPELWEEQESIDAFLDENDEIASDFEYLSGEMWMRLQKALDELPPKQRMVFEMNELQGIPLNEIAQQTGDPVNTLISRKHYAVQHLRKRLKTIYDEMIYYF
jgi:RNA polymerase sigma factor (sigma-70 family)